MIRWPVKLRIVHKPGRFFDYSLQRKFLWWWYEVDFNHGKSALEISLKEYMKKQKLTEVSVEDTTIAYYKLINGKVTVAI